MVSTPRSGLPPDQEGPRRLEDDPDSPGQTVPEAAENDNANSGSIASTETSGSASAVDALRGILRSLKKPPGAETTRGLCNDGVIRIMIWLPLTAVRQCCSACLSRLSTLSARCAFMASETLAVGRQVRNAHMQMASGNKNRP